MQWSSQITELKKTKTTCQQSDKNYIWVKARFQANAQLLARFGIDLPDDTCGMKIQDQAYINQEKLRKAGHDCQVEQIGWWDEKHIEQVVGELKKETYQFGIDEYGVYDPDVEIEVVRKVSSTLLKDMYAFMKKFQLTYF